MSQFEYTDPNSGEKFTLNTSSLIADLRNVLLSRRRLDLGNTPWRLLSEQQQRDEISKMEAFSEELVHSIVYEIAQAGRKVLHATLENWTVKNDGTAKVVMKGRADDEFVLALNRIGKHVLKISVADTEQFDQTRANVEIIPDQPDLPLDAGMTDEDIDSFSKEADSALDRLEDDDDMRTEESTEPEPGPEPQEEPQPEKAEKPKSRSKKAADPAPEDLSKEGDAKAFQQGQQAYIDGLDVEKNPYKLEDAMFLSWEQGWNAMAAQVDMLRAMLADDNQADGGFPQGTMADRIFNAIKVAISVAVPDDATTSGAKAREVNVPLHGNPYQSGTPQYRFWRDGWRSQDKLMPVDKEDVAE